MEIIAFSNGDSRDINTWSNVPYLFLKHLEASGDDVKIHRVNLCLEDENRILKFAVKCLNKILRLIGGNFNTIDRSRLYDYFVTRKMKKAVEKYPDSTWMISFDFSHVLPNTGMRTLLFCDWTIQYAIEVQNNRKPTRFESGHIQRQNGIINQADKVVTFFPNVYDYMREKHGEKVSYIGNFINTVEDGSLDIEKRFKSNDILFVGRKHYLPALISLMDAVKQYNHKNGTCLRLHVIGMDQSMIPAEDFVTCYGYLRKDDSVEREQYYELMRGARVLVNTADRWVGASSIIEAMYFGMPVIIQPNEDIVKTFGDEALFGYYCPDNHPESIQDCIEQLMNLNQDQYHKLCLSAQDSVSEFTWDAYINRLKKLLDN